MQKLTILLLFIPFIFNAQDIANKPFKEAPSFIPNKGQFDNRNWQKNNQIEYACDFNKAFIFFAKDGLTYRFDKIIRHPDHKEGDSDSPKRTNISELIHVKWIAANPNPEIIAEGVRENYYSYAIKNLDTKEVINENNIPGYSKLTYKNIYDNVDVEYTFHPEGGVKYSIIVHSGADVSKIKMRYSKEYTKIGSESIEYFLDKNGEIQINTSLNSILEHSPFTFYNDSKQEISSSFRFENDILSFNIEDYDNSKTIVIDPWVQSPAFTTSTAVWEVETDGIGNVYVIGGETPMELKKYNSAGVIQWTYTTPWDTASVWLGTLATNNAGVSFITSGTTPEIERVSTAGAMAWHNASGGIFSLTEWWSITFNCDKTKLIVGGTGGSAPPFGTPKAVIYEMDINNGNVIGQADVHVGASGGLMASPIEVRSISSSKDAKYIFLTHLHVGAIMDNIGACPQTGPIYKLDNGHHLGYKCENYLPATQNGGGLKALIANDQYIYTNSGDQIHQRLLSDGTLVTSVALPGGNSNTIPIVGGLEVENSGMAVDDCGNVYAGSGDRVVKFDANLNILQQVNVPFTVYDVSVNSNGEVLACGAQNDNQAINRNGRVQAIDMSACAQFALVCCDANICPVGTYCQDDLPFNIPVSQLGGTFSGTGITDPVNGTFDPSVAGPGIHTITYTLPCGFETIDIEVNPCIPIEVCDDGTNYIATGGSGALTWYDWESVTVNTTTQALCVSCGGTWNPGFPPIIPPSCSVASCTQDQWVQIGTGTSITTASVNSFPLMVTDGLDSVTYVNAAAIPPCSACTPPTLSSSVTHVICSGGTDGAIDLTVTPGSGSSYTYSWTGPSGYTNTSEDISGLEAGTYNVTVTDAANASCFATLSITVNPGAATEDASFTFNSFCEGAANSATGIATPGGTFSFNPVPSNGETINSSTGEITGGIGGNSYTIQYTTSGACPGTSTQTVNVNGVTYTAATTPEACGAGDGEIVLTPTSGTGPYTYSIDGGTTTQGNGTFSGLTAGNYNIVITDGNGCSVTGTENVGSQGGPTIDNMINTDPSCAGICNGEISVTVSGGTPPYSYQWYDAGNNPIGTNAASITGLCAGDYSVEVTDAAGGGTTILNSNGDFEAGLGGNCDCPTGYSCSNDAGQVFDGTHPVFTVGNQGCIGGMNYTSSIGAYSGTGYVYFYAGSDAISTGPYAFVGGETVEICVYYSGPQGSGASGQNTANSHFTLGVDGVSVTPDVLVPTNTGWTQYCFTVVMTAGNHTFDILSGGAAQYSIWFDDFTISLQSGTGCPTTQAATLVDPAPIDASFTFADFCEGSTNGPTNIATPGGTFTFNPAPGGGETINPSTGVISNEIGGNSYTIEYTTGGACSASSTQTITVNASPTPSIAGSTTFCTGSSTTLDAGAGYTTYSWSPAGSNQTITASTAGTYIVTVTDANGCTGTDQVDVTVATNLSPNITGVLTICSGASTSLDAGAGYAGYLWSTSETTQTITVTTAGTYDVTVSDASGCTGNDQVVVTANTNPTPAITGSLSFCIGGSTVLDAGAGYTTYLWNPAGASQTFSVNSAGTYSVTVTDANGCTGTDQVDVTVAANLTPSITGVLSFCPGGSTTLDAGSGYTTYAWSPSGNTQVISVSNAGTYIVTVTDASGCTGTDQANVTEASSIVATLTPTNVVCNGGTGSIDLNIAGGAAPYTYVWSTGATTEDLTGISVGNYTVTITDASGCTTSGSTALTEPAAIVISSSSDQTICNGQAATINVSVVGGVQPYTYVWSHASINSPTIYVSPSAETVYSVFVQDANGCISNTETTTITVSPALDLQVVANTEYVCPGDPAILTISPSNGAGPPYMVFVDNSVQTSPYVVYPTGTTTYTVTAEDGCGSTATETVTINVYDLPPISFQSDTLNGCQPLTVHFTENSPDIGQTFSWNFGDYDNNNLAFTQSPTHEYDDAGVYTVTLTVVSAEGCSNTQVVNDMITVYPRPTAKFIADPEVVSVIKPTVYFTNLSLLNDSSYWYFGDGDSSNAVNPYHAYPQYPTGTYIVELVVSTKHGCRDTVYGTVIVEDEYTFYAPTAFSPDFDGVNDVFYVYGNGIDNRHFKMLVYDRWGEVIFESYDINEGWDGRANGGDVVKVGTYTWLVIFQTNNKVQHQEAGAVTIIR